MSNSFRQQLNHITPQRVLHVVEGTLTNVTRTSRGTSRQPLHQYDFQIATGDLGTLTGVFFSESVKNIATGVPYRFTLLIKKPSSLKAFWNAVEESVLWIDTYKPLGPRP